MYGQSQPCKQVGSHPMLRSHYIVEYLLISVWPSSIHPHMHHSHSNMSYTSLNIAVRQNCSPETRHSVPFKLTYMLILHPYMSTRHTYISFDVFTSFGSCRLTEQRLTLTLLMIRETSLFGLCVCHLSGNIIIGDTLILDSFGWFILGVALFTSSSVINGLKAYSVQNILSSQLFSTNLKIKIYKTVSLLVVPMKC